MDDRFRTVTDAGRRSHQMMGLFNEDRVCKALPVVVVIHAVLDKPEEEAFAQEGLLRLVQQVEFENHRMGK